MTRHTRLAIKKVVDAIKLLSIELLIVLVAFVTALVTVVFFIKLIFLDKEQKFDTAVFDFLGRFVSDGMTSVMNFFTFFGGQFFLIPANLLLIAYTFFIKRDKWFAIRVLSVALSSLFLMFFLKYIFNRPRPLIPLLEQVGGLSFPSGHAYMSFAFFGLLIYTVNKKVETLWIRYSLVAIFFLMTVFIGLSRIYLRVHYASDVIAGFSLGLMWLVISLLIIHRIEKYKTKLPPVSNV